MLTLVIPNLFRRADETLPEIHTPHLNQFLQFARFQAAETSRAQLYFDYLNAPTPLPENQVYASPVWQQMDMNSATMLDGAHLAIDAATAEKLCADLNTFYSGEYVFQAAKPYLWTLTLPKKPTWHAPSILDVSGQVFGEELATGDARQGLKLSAEMQMFLHAHKINQDRTAPINGIWLWNAPSENNINNQIPIASNSQWANAEKSFQAANFTEFQQHENWQNGIIFLDELTACYDTGNTQTYAQILQNWDAKWFTPLVENLKNGSLKNAQIVCNRGYWIWKNRAHWAFWRGKQKFVGK